MCTAPLESPPPDVREAIVPARALGEISRLVGTGLAARGFDVHNLFFFQQSSSFEAPPD